MEYQQIFTPGEINLISILDALKINHTNEDLKGVDGYTLHYKNKFLLCYDAFAFPMSRIRFTIAHEIGHIVLGHFDYDESVINSSKFKHYFDFEANCFAAELLMPKFMLEEYNTCCKEEVTKEFHVSNKAIETRIKILNSSSFLNNFYIDFCKECGSLIYARRPFYCQSCGGKINNIRVLSNF